MCVQAEPVAVFVVLGTHQFKTFVVIDGIFLFFQGIDAFNSQLSKKSHIIAAFEVSDIAVCKYQEYALEVDLRDIPDQVDYQVFL